MDSYKCRYVLFFATDLLKGVEIENILSSAYDGRIEILSRYTKRKSESTIAEKLINNMVIIIKII